MGKPNTANPIQATTGRISVVRDQHLVPLLASTSNHIPAGQPWTGVLLERHQVHPGEIPEHEHPDLCLHLQLSGDADFEWWSGGRHAVERTQPGSLILIPPGTRDRLRWQGASERLILSVAHSGLADLTQHLEAPPTPAFKGNWSLHDGALRQLLTEMGHEARNGWPLGALYADLLTLGLHTRLLQSHAAVPLAASPVKGGLSLPKLKRAMEFINAHLADDIDLGSIANVLDLSPSHFAHEFRHSTGQTPFQYLLDQRMARARQLLRSTNLPVQFISAQTGFKSPVNFIRSFRQRIGLTPQAWRKSL